MRNLRVTLSLLFSLCAFVSVVDSLFLLPEDTTNYNKKDVHSLNSKDNDMILSVTRELEDVMDVYSLEDNEENTTEDGQTEQDDIPIIIPSVFVHDVPGILSNSSETSEEHKTTQSEIPLQTFEPTSSTEVLKRVDKMMTQIKAQGKIINELKKNEKNLRDKFDQIDQKTKQNNVIFMSIRESKHETYKSLLQKVIQILNRIMRLRVTPDDIVMASRINGGNVDRIRPVVVTFTNFATKLRVLTARSKLKKSKFDILDDYSELVNQTRRLLLPILYEMRRQGHKVSMVRDRLIVNGVKKSLNDLQHESSRKLHEENSKPKKDFEDKNSQDNLKADQ